MVGWGGGRRGVEGKEWRGFLKVRLDASAN